MDVWRGVRTSHYTYARYEDATPWLLYDDIADPYQMKNLAADARFAPVRRQLDLELDRLLVEAGDPFNTKLLYERIMRETPNSPQLRAIREANPQSPWGLPDGATAK
jgi:hypothetical protein